MEMGAGGEGSAGEKPTAFNPMRFLKPVCQGTEQMAFLIVAHRMSTYKQM